MSDHRIITVGAAVAMVNVIDMFINQLCFYLIYRNPVPTQVDTKPTQSSSSAAGKRLLPVWLTAGVSNSQQASAPAPKKRKPIF